MPPFRWRKPVSCDANLARHYRLELVVRDLQEGKQLSDEHPDIAFIDQREAQVKGPPSNADIGIAQAFQYRVPMSLHRVRFNGHNLDEGIECHITDVIVSVCQELPKDINPKNTKPRIGIDVQNG